VRGRTSHHRQQTAHQQAGADDVQERARPPDQWRRGPAEGPGQPAGSNRRQPRAELELRRLGTGRAAPSARTTGPAAAAADRAGARAGQRQQQTRGRPRLAGVLAEPRRRQHHGATPARRRRPADHSARPERRWPRRRPAPKTAEDAGGRAVPGQGVARRGRSRSAGGRAVRQGPDQENGRDPQVARASPRPAAPSRRWPGRATATQARHSETVADSARPSPRTARRTGPAGDPSSRPHHRQRQRGRG